MATLAISTSPMLASTTTTTALLQGLLASGNDAVWTEFDARYRPILVAFARRLGFDEDDAAEIAQQTMADFVRDYRANKYDRQRGRLSQWIIAIARHRAVDLRRARNRRREIGRPSALLRIPDPLRLSQIWDEEHSRCLVDQALEALREQTRTAPDTLRVFELVVVDGLPPAAVAEQCGVEVADVYRIKNRLTRRLRELVRACEAAYQESA